LLAGGGINRAGAAQRGEAGLGAEPVGVVASGNQQLGGDLGGHALLGRESRPRKPADLRWADPHNKMCLQPPDW
jgi:hypothetical protein